MPPHPDPLPQVERRDGRKNFKRPLTLPSPTAGRGKKVDEKILTAPLTLILSRMGREEKLREFI
jgi:hypothetical protein